MRLIDADKLQLEPVNNTMNGVLFVGQNSAKTLNMVKSALKTMLQNAPTVDTVAVVRCVKCKYYDPDSEYCQFWHGVRHPGHYCGEGASDGE